MVVRVTYFGNEGYKCVRHFFAPSMDEVLKVICKRSDIFQDVIEVKAVVRDYVENLYDIESKIMVDKPATKKAY